MTRIDASYGTTGGVERVAGSAAVARVAEASTSLYAVTDARHLVFRGWRAAEIEPLRFLRALVETGRIAH